MTTTQIKYENLLTKLLVRMTDKQFQDNGVYALVNAQGEPYYIGRAWNYTIHQRLTCFKPVSNDFTHPIIRGHLWELAWVIMAVMESKITYEDRKFARYEDRVRYYMDYWIDKKGEERNDGLINWFKITKMFTEIVTRNCIEVKLLVEFDRFESKKTAERFERCMINQYQPSCNIEFAVDESIRYAKLEAERQKLYRMLREFRPDIQEPKKENYGKSLV